MLEIAVALVRRGEALLFLRRERAPLVGLWELPGGKVEPGESAEAAALRELAEETGLVGVRASHVATVEHADPWARVRLHAFAVEARGEPRVGAWREPVAWQAEDVLPGTRRLLADLVRGGGTVKA